MTEFIPRSVYDFSAPAIDGHELPLAQYKGKVLVIVNTASKCGFTPQYAGLETLYQRYKDRGLVVLGFPCNQFGRQEPGAEAEIAEFCERKYGVSFPLFAKIDVNGPHALPLYQFLKKEKTGAFGMRGIKWNFTKFLVDRNGKAVKRYAPAIAPAELGPAVEELLT